MTNIWSSIHAHDEILGRIEALDASSEFTPEEKADTLQGIYGEMEAAFLDLHNAVGGWGRQRGDLDANIAALKERAKFYQAKARAVETYIERVDGMAIEAMRKAQREKVTCDGLTVAVHYSDAVVVTCMPGDLPEKFQRVKTTCEPDKTGLKAAIKEGQEIPGVILVRNPSLRVR